MKRIKNPLTNEATGAAIAAVPTFAIAEALFHVNPVSGAILGGIAGLIGWNGIDTAFNAVDACLNYDVPRRAKRRTDEPEKNNDRPRVGQKLPKNVLTFSQVLSGDFVPTAKRILLGREMENVFCSPYKLGHIALAGRTGGGKSSLMRLLMSQMCVAGCKVLLLNPHYTRYDREADEDWGPFEKHLADAPAYEFEEIGHHLEYAARYLLQERMRLYRQGELVGAPYYIVIDELPAIIAECKDAAKHLARIFREGRKLNVFLLVSAQDFLVKTLGLDDTGGAVLKSFGTAFYVGGDQTTATKLLNVEAKKISENSLGKGTVMLRCDALKFLGTVKVPYVDNESLYRLLGRAEPYGEADGSDFDGMEALSGEVCPQARMTRNEQEAEAEADATSMLRGIAKRVRSGEKLADIRREFNLPTNGRAGQEVNEALRWLGQNLENEE
jgi:hypothetical protein